MATGHRFWHERFVSLQSEFPPVNYPGLAVRASRTDPHSALAQLVEQLTVNQRVVGSSPTGGANNSLKTLDVFNLR
jgi:hypothetical protein